MDELTDTRPLSRALLDRLPEGVAGPLYERSQLSRGIVHVGLGNFHRAHQAVYLDQLFDQGLDHDWAIVGASLRENDRAVRDDLQAQDWLTTVVELDPQGFDARVCGAMIDYAEIDPEAVVAAMADEAIRIVSLTITEGGYYVDAEGAFDADHADIRHDAANPHAPRTVFGSIVRALGLRRERGAVPFTVMSCDNLPENGQVARATVLGLAALQPGDMRDWIAEHLAFPNSMVDCITPATSAREIAMVEQRFGIRDRRPVACEPFRQWVMEDRFTAGRPRLEMVGVEFTDDVAPYELMKLRILNGGHATIAYPAALLDIDYVHDAMAHPLVSGFLAKLERDEIVPTVPDIPGVSKDDYLATVTERFSNHAIGDTIPRLCLDGSNRQPKFIVPVIEDRVAADASVEGVALESALWCRYCFGETESGTAIAPNDPQWDRLQSQARSAKDEPARWLAMRDIYGPVGDDERFRTAFTSALGAIWRDGTVRTLEAYLAG